MGTRDGAAGTAPASLAERAPAEPARPTGPPWVVIPARIIALVVVLPVRLGYDLVRLLWRGTVAGLRGLMRSPLWLARQVGRFGRAVFDHVLRPIGAGVAWLWTNGVARPVGWLLRTLLLLPLRLFGRGTGKLGRWFYRTLLAPVGRFFAVLGRGVLGGLRWIGGGFAWAGRGVLAVLVFLGLGIAAGFRWIGRGLDYVLLQPLLALGRGLMWVLERTAHYFMVGLKGVGTGLAWLLAVLLVLPATLLWRYVLWPPLAGLAWLARRTGGLFMRVGRTLGIAIAGIWAAFTGAIGWAWRTTGRLLYWLARVLFVLPALLVWRYLLRPVFQAVAAAWRLAARGLRWLWRTFVVAPARWTKDSVLLPVGRGLRSTWHVTVRDPARWVGRIVRDTSRSISQTMRQTGREVRGTIRRTFRGV